MRRLLLLILFLCPVAASALPSPAPSRIVSLAPAATEFLFALGLGDRVVGVTTYCDRPASAKQIAKIGGFADPQLEAIIKLRPDLVVTTGFGNAKNIAVALNARGIKTLSNPVESLEDMKRFLVALGQTTGKSALAKQLQTQFDAQFTALHNKTLSGKPKVLLLVSGAPLIAAGPSTFPGEVLSHLGALNIVKPTQPAWPVLSLEALMSTPPDVIVVTEGPQGLAATKRSLAPLISKYKTRLIAPAKPLLQRPGPFLIEDIQALLKMLQSTNA